MTRLSTISGHAAVPHGLSNLPRSRDHSGLPSSVYAWMPPIPKNATTTWPSVTQLAEAQPFITWLFSGSPFQAVCCQRILPVLRSTQKTRRSLPFSRYEVRNIRSPQIIGDDWPMPGSDTFHSRFFSDHLTGKSDSDVCPFC